MHAKLDLWTHLHFAECHTTYTCKWLYRQAAHFALLSKVTAVTVHHKPASVAPVAPEKKATASCNTYIWSTQQPLGNIVTHLLPTMVALLSCWKPVAQPQGPRAMQLAVNGTSTSTYLLLQLLLCAGPRYNND